MAPRGRAGARRSAPDRAADRDRRGPTRRAGRPLATGRRARRATARSRACSSPLAARGELDGPRPGPAMHSRARLGSASDQAVAATSGRQRGSADPGVSASTRPAATGTRPSRGVLRQRCARACDGPRSSSGALRPNPTRGGSGAAAAHRAHIRADDLHTNLQWPARSAHRANPTRGGRARERFQRETDARCARSRSTAGDGQPRRRPVSLCGPHSARRDRPSDRSRAAETAVAPGRRGGRTRARVAHTELRRRPGQPFGTRADASTSTR